MLFRWAIGVGAPTDIDWERCILFWTRLTVNITGDLSGKQKENDKKQKTIQINNN